MLVFKLKLSVAQRAQLVEMLRIAQKLGQRQPVTRVLAILALAEETAHTVASVASVLQVSTEAVRQWLTGFLAHGPKSLAAKKRPGQPGRLTYSVYYIAQLLKNLGLSYQKARFVAHDADPAQRQEWVEQTWPALLKWAREKKAYILFGDEASFPQWGTLTYTWAPRGEQPMVKTSGKRKGYKVFGLIDYFSGRFFYTRLWPFPALQEMAKVESVA